MSSERQPTPEAVRQGIRDAAAAREFLAPHVQPILEHWAKIATADTANGMKASENIVDRVIGKVPLPERVEMTHSGVTTVVYRWGRPEAKAEAEPE